MALYCLRGDTVVYRATIRDGGLDLRDRPRSIVQEVTVIGAGVALQVPLDGPLTIDGREQYEPGG